MGTNGLAHVDGSVRPKNPGFGARACVLQFDDTVVIAGSHLGSGITNNVAELLAVELAIDLGKEFGLESTAIASDSEYAVNVLNGTYKAKSHLETIFRIREKMTGVVLNWVRGHASDSWNLFIDKFANRIALDPTYKPYKKVYTRHEFLKEGNDFLKKEFGA